MLRYKNGRSILINSDSSPSVEINLNVRGLHSSATVAINERSNELIKTGQSIFKLGLGQSPFPVPKRVVEALQQNAFQKDYLPVKGLLELRKTVADHHQRAFDIECTADDVLIGPGSKELMFLLQLAYYGDLVVPAPSWVSYVPQAKIIGRHIRSLLTTAENDWQLTPQQLDECCRSDPGRPRVLVLNYPSNPTGRTYSLDQLLELAEVARRYRMVVLSDEIYGKINHDDSHESIVPLYPEGTIFSGGLSKWCGAGGWRLGLFVFPTCMRWMLDSMAVIASETFTSTSAPIQYAAITAFQEHVEIDTYLAQSRRILKVLGNKLYKVIRAGDIDVPAPQGGFYLMPSFNAKREKLQNRGIHTSMELCERLLEDTGVAILPGNEFGIPQNDLTARLAYVNFDGTAALEAAETIPDELPLSDDFLQTYCPETISAVERLVDWVNA